MEEIHRKLYIHTDLILFDQSYTWSGRYVIVRASGYITYTIPVGLHNNNTITRYMWALNGIKCSM